MSITHPETLSRRSSGTLSCFLQNSQNRQGGFSIVAAIFILVVLAGLAGFIVSTSNTQHMTQAIDVLNSRAQQAARTGIEWGVYQVVKVPAGTLATACALPAATYLAPYKTPTALSVLEGMTEFVIEVECGSAAFTEGSETYRVYEITATACNAAACPSTTPGAGYVEHQQRARVKMP